MNVKIVPRGNSGDCAGSDYVCVSTCSDPLDDTVTLATIQRFVERLRMDEAAGRIHVKTLIMKQPMSGEQALGLATCYAERKNIPVVYTD